MVQLSVIEAGFAERVTARGNKQDDCAEPFLAFTRAKQLHKLGRVVHCKAVSGQWSGDKSQETGVRSQESEVRHQKSVVST